MRALDPVLLFFKRRVPGRSDILSVFNVVVFVVFSWSVRGFLFELTSFLLYLHVLEIASILFYMMAFALLESFFIMGVLLLFSVALPSTWLKVGFGYKSFLIMLISTIGLILFQGYYKYGFFETLIKNDYSTLRPLFFGGMIAVFVMVGLLRVFKYPSKLKGYLMGFIEQFGIFAYIYLPLGLIGLLILLVRNI
jgi:hypothetical protein